MEVELLNGTPQRPRFPSNMLGIDNEPRLSPAALKVATHWAIPFEARYAIPTTEIGIDGPLQVFTVAELDEGHAVEVWTLTAEGFRRDELTDRLTRDDAVCRLSWVIHALLVRQVLAAPLSVLETMPVQGSA